MLWQVLGREQKFGKMNFTQHHLKFTKVWPSPIPFLRLLYSDPQLLANVYCCVRVRFRLRVRFKVMVRGRVRV